MSIFTAHDMNFSYCSCKEEKRTETDGKGTDEAPPYFWKEH